MTHWRLRTKKVRLQIVPAQRLSPSERLVADVPGWRIIRGKNLAGYILIGYRPSHRSTLGMKSDENLFVLMLSAIIWILFSIPAGTGRIGSTVEGSWGWGNVLMGRGTVPMILLLTPLSLLAVDLGGFVLVVSLGICHGPQSPKFSETSPRDCAMRQLLCPMSKEESSMGLCFDYP